MLALALVQAFPLIAVAGNDPSRFACNQRSKRERFAESCEYNEKGMALEEQGKAREALALYKMAIAAYPTYAVNYCNYGNALADLKRYSEAITQYKKAVSIQPDFAAAYNNMADAMMHQKDYIGAELACKSSIRVDPGYVPAMTNLAEVYISTNKPHEAISVLNKARGLTTTAAMKKIIADDLDIATKLLNTTLTKVSSVADYSGSAKD
jgi:tetratricopeptide (TPR) repeat protein